VTFVDLKDCKNHALHLSFCTLKLEYLTDIIIKKEKNHRDQIKEFTQKDKNMRLLNKAISLEKQNSSLNNFKVL